MGLSSFDDLEPHMLRRRITHGRIVSYADLVEPMETGQLLTGSAGSWADDWRRADPDTFTP